MTKEEILDPFRKMSDSSTSWVYEEDAIKAMDEYAKQQAIAFADWLIKEGYYMDRVDGRWKSVNSKYKISWYTSDLHDKFIEQQNKDNG